MRQDASNSYWIFQSYSTNSLKFINGSLNAKRKAINTKVKGKISKFSSTMSILSVSCILFSLCYYYGTVESHQFPTTLKGFGYGFNDLGQLRKINPIDGSFTSEPYGYVLGDGEDVNEEYHAAFLDALSEHVYQLLLDLGLHKINVPYRGTEKPTFVFGTKTNFANTKKLMFLIHGGGHVRAGQWSRRLIINQSINHGTQIPYIKRAIELGYDVLVTNTNLNVTRNWSERKTPEQHISAVWEHLIAPVYDTIESFAVIAHSYGGFVTLQMAKNYPNAFLEKCFAVGFTDSVHQKAHEMFGLEMFGSNEMFGWFREHARNYVKSDKPLNTTLYSSEIPHFSAGHREHEWTSWACMEVLFPYLEEQYAKWLATRGHQQRET